MPPPILTTERLRLREFAEADAPFVFDLVTQPSWLEHIGDRGVRSLDDARAYVRDRLRPSYAQHGFGFWAVERREDNVPLGLCGIVRRPGLDAEDLGYAFLPAYWGRGYAREAAAATVAYARDTLGLGRLLAIVAPANAPSIRVLEAVGMRYERDARMDGDSEDVRVYALDLGT